MQTDIRPPGSKRKGKDASNLSLQGPDQGRVLPLFFYPNIIDYVFILGFINGKWTLGKTVEREQPYYLGRM
jgi:hypothetical protein